MKILLLGAAKTGTTAITYAIHEHFPDYEVVFEPPSLERIDYGKENLIVKSLRVRDWDIINQRAKQFDRRVLIVRHPLDRLISTLLYEPFNGRGFSSDQVTAEYLELLWQKSIDPESVHIKQIVNYFNQLIGGKITRGFQAQYQDIARLAVSDSDFFVLRYEDFIDGNLAALGQYLNLEFIPLNVEVPEKYQRVSRTKNYDDWKNWFTVDDLEYFSLDFSEICNILQYDLTPDLEHSKVISPEQSYEYVRKVINESRRMNFLPEFEQGQIRMIEEGLKFDQAREKLRSGKFSEAASLVQQAISLKPEIAGFYLLLGKVLARENQKKAAATAIVRAIELNPEVEKNLPQNLLKIKNSQSRTES
ncbi:MAG: tetratricopeptide repeat protein [Microcoleaceae cyanobacterium]